MEFYSITVFQLGAIPWEQSILQAAMKMKYKNGVQTDCKVMIMPHYDSMMFDIFNKENIIQVVQLLVALSPNTVWF